eukprot:866168-Pleurochrysis_carterae.AAC.1
MEASQPFSACPAPHPSAAAAAAAAAACALARARGRPVMSTALICACAVDDDRRPGVFFLGRAQQIACGAKARATRRETSAAGSSASGDDEDCGEGEG